MFSLRKVFNLAVKKRIGRDNCLTIPGHQINLLMLDSIITFGAKTTFSESIQLVDLAFQKHTMNSASEDTTPIIIMHGLLGSKNNWNSMAKALVKSTSNRIVITVDARNHGDSPHSDQFSYTLMMQDLVKLLSKQGISKASFIGHSMGGRVCMLLAQMHPQLVEDLVVVDISPVGHSPNMLELPKIFKTIIDLNIPGHLSISEARKNAAMLLKAQLKDDSLVAFLLTNIVEGRNGSGWRWKFNINAISKNFQSEVVPFPTFASGCDKRTLFVAGEKSDYIRQKDIPTIQQYFPNSRFVFIEGAGHWVHVDKPKPFLDTVTEFLVHPKL